MMLNHSFPTDLQLDGFSQSQELIRASGSVEANYIEANEAVRNMDFIMRINISRMESKRIRYSLRLIIPADGQSREQELLVQESTELLMIFTTILK